jgi:hypothetical protein
MEGRYAIFTEKWIVAMVRVHTFRVTDRWIKARICAIPTPGLYGKNQIEIGTIHEHFQEGCEIWVCRGYCDWRVLFAQTVIDEVLRIASLVPKDWICDPADPHFNVRFAALMHPFGNIRKGKRPIPT